MEKCGLMAESELKIPKDRVGAIIGPRGEVKKKIEEKTGTRIEVGSENGETTISSESDDFMPVHLAESIVKAIGRGFSPENAILLAADNIYLEIIDLRDYVGKSDKAIEQKKGRIIGKGGQAREEIEKETSAKISVYGRTVGIIGSMDAVEKAKAAIEMLIAGASHTTVFNFLAKKKDYSKGFEL